MTTSAEMLANRLRKNRRHRAKWARRADISCYRLYDRDIPEVPLSIDWYAGDVYLAEWVRNATTDADREAWRQAIQAELQVDQLFEKQRARQRGSAQYSRQAESNQRKVVHEGGLRFYVNLRDYLDTGLFLDHRQTRAMVAEEVAGKRLLNLFAYTGTFSVYAAAVGAHTTTVDMSRTYLDWALDNFRLNELDAGAHRFIQADALAWIPSAAGERYDVIVLDPPSFSNSKRMDQTFDVGRDHLALLRATLPLLAPQGALYFSTNAQRFKLDPAVADLAEVEDITQRTVPPDFKQRRPHRCWRLTQGDS